MVWIAVFPGRGTMANGLDSIVCPNIKIAINGKGSSIGHGKWKAATEDIDHFYAIYMGHKHAL